MYPPFNQIQLGPLTVHIYGIIIAFAGVVGYWIAKKRAYLYNFNEKVVDDLLPLVIISAVIGARLYHVIDKWQYYQNHQLEIFAIWQGGIGIYGGLLAALAAIWFFARKYHLAFLSLLDLLSPSVALMQAIGRWGNFFNQEAFGRPTQSQLNVYIDQAYRPWFWQSYERFQPLFLYESAFDLLTFAILLLLAKRLQLKPGMLSAYYFIGYGLTRLFVEQYRFDTAMVGPFKTASLLSFVSIVSGAVFLLICTRRTGNFSVKLKNHAKRSKPL